MKTNPISGQVIRPVWQIRAINFFDFKFKLAIHNSKKTAKKYADQFEGFLRKQIESDSLSDFHKKIAGQHILNSRVKTAKDLKALDDLKWRHSIGL